MAKIRAQFQKSLSTSHLGGKTFDTWNWDVWSHVKTCFAQVRSWVDAIDSRTVAWMQALLTLT